MNRFTISPDLLEFAATEESCDTLLNVLLVFVQDNQYKLCMDKLGLASTEYENIIKEHERLAFWIEMLNMSHGCIETVSITASRYDSNQELFLAIANAAYPSKRLVTYDKSSFSRWQDYIEGHGINLIDGDETKALLRTPINVQISLGDNSPNIIGNNNHTE